MGRTDHDESSPMHRRFVLIPGAGGVAWYWSRVVPLLQEAGHQAVAVDLPGDDPQAGLPEYADLVARAAAGSDDVVLVAQSLGGFTAPLACEQIPVRALVLVNAMIPEPGERAGAWWDHVGWERARCHAADAGGYSRELDIATYFLHDVPPDVTAAGGEHQRPEAELVFDQPCTFTSWPSVPIRVVAGADDRFFPVGLQQRVARDRLGLDVDVLPGGHLVAQSKPGPLVAYLNRVAAAA
jgi:pimeloyl-ACP methyl ester carboxylesterase